MFSIDIDFCDCRKHKKSFAVTRIRTEVASATTKSTDHYTITAIAPLCISMTQTLNKLEPILRKELEPILLYAGFGAN